MPISATDLNKAYLAYFGRPADLTGKTYFATLEQADVIQAFDASAESKALYGDNVASKVNAIYQNLFNRDAEPEGLVYWTTLINQGRVTAAGAALAILNGAQGTDTTAVTNKLATSEAFVAALNTTPELVGYSGMEAAASARSWLKAVGADAASLTAAIAGVDAAVTAAVAVGGGGVPGATFTLTASAVSVEEGGNATFALTLDSAPTSDVTVNYVTATGTAGSSDYTSVSGTVTFAAGQTSQFVTIATTEDSAFEADETFTVTFSGSSLTASVTATGTITNDDVDPSTQVQTYTLTTGTDALPATAGADTVIGQLGALTTLQASDQIYGNDGSDTLRVVTDGSSAQAVSGFKLESVETVEVQSGATGGTTLGLARADAALAAVRSSGSTSSVTIDGLSKLVAAEIANTTGTALTLNYASAATTGTTTAQGLAVNAANATFNAAGVEIVNVAATGANTLAFGTAPATINVSGAGSLDLGALTATTTTINASANTGGVKATAGASATATVTGGSGADEFNVSAVTGNVVVSAGAGNDTITATAGLTATDSIAGGDGQDTLVTTGTVADAVLAKVTSVETVQASGALTVTLGANAKAAGVIAVKADGANALSVTTATGFDGALAVTAGTGTNTVNNAGNATLTVTGTESSLAGANLTGGTGNDTLVVTATSAAALDLSGVTGFETITVLPNATTAGEAVKLVLGANTVAAGKTLTIDASALSATGAKLEVDTLLVPATATVVVVGGAQADTITGGASKHNLNGGAGDDVFDFSGTTLNADTTINGGDGADTLKVASVTAAALANVSNVENLAFTANASLNANISFTSFDLGAVDGGQELTLATGYTNATTVKLGQAGDKIINNANVALTVNSSVAAANATGAVQGGTGTDILNLSSGGSLELASNVTGVEVINLADRGDAAPAEGVTNDRGVDYTITTGNYASDATVATVLTINGADLDAGVLDADGVMISGSDEVVTVDAAALIANSKVAVSVTGGGAADQITGGAGNDTILGGAGNDVINVGGGNNAVNGGDGDDAITATATGNNLLLGGAGNDAFVLDGALTGEDSIDGGAGVNSLQVNAGTTNLDFLNVYNVQTLKLATASTTTTLGANAQAAGINRIEGHSGSDIINAAAFTRGVTFVSGTGNDSLTGGTADDVFAFSESQLNESASDTLIGGTGADTIRLDNASSSGVGSAVTANLTNVSGIERVVINDLSKTTDTAGDVSVTVNTAMTFVGNALTIDGSSLDLGETLTVSAYTLVADDAATTTTNEAQHLSVIGGAGSDSITAGGGNDTLIGGSGADSIVGGAGVDTISGGDGRDYLSGGTGNDTIDGGNGTDIVIGGAGKDLLTGGAGGDTFVFEAVSESVGEGADVITDFVSGKDKVFINTAAITSGTISDNSSTNVVFKGNAANFEGAQAVLVVGQAGAVYNQGTKTLWIDANRDGTLNANDLQIVLQNGPASLVAADVTFGATSPAALDLVTWLGTVAAYTTAKENLETEDSVTIADSYNSINANLTSLLADSKIDVIDATSGPGSTITLTQAQSSVAANLAKLVADDDVTVTDAQINTQAEAVAAYGISVVDHVDITSAGSLVLNQASAVAANATKLSTNGTITVSDVAINTHQEVAALGLLSYVDAIDITATGAVTLSMSQYGLNGGGAKITTNGTVTIADSTMSAPNIDTFNGYDNVDVIDFTGGTVTLTQQQALGATKLGTGGTVNVIDSAVDTQAEYNALQALARVDTISINGGTLTLDVPSALGATKLQTSGTVTVSGSSADVWANWSALSGTTGVGPSIDGFDLIDNAITLTEAQYTTFSVGSKTFAANDVVTISGQVGASALDASQAVIKLQYTSGAQASIVTFDDVTTPTSLVNTDQFNLVSADLITGFTAGDKIDLTTFKLSGQAQVTDFTTDYTVLRDGSYIIVQGTWTDVVDSANDYFTASNSGLDSLVLFDANTGTGNTAINMVGVVVDGAVLSITDLILV